MERFGFGMPSEAVQLFTERAQAVVPAFAVTEANREAVERIVRRLDGIPLAIELAVVRLRALSVHQVLALSFFGIAAWLRGDCLDRRAGPGRRCRR